MHTQCQKITAQMYFELSQNNFNDVFIHVVSPKHCKYIQNKGLAIHQGTLHCKFRFIWRHLRETLRSKWQRHLGLLVELSCARVFQNFHRTEVLMHGRGRCVRLLANSSQIRMRLFSMNSIRRFYTGFSFVLTNYQ